MLLKRAVVLALLAVGCNPCTSEHAEGGETPFSRCLRAEPGPVPERVGALTLRVEDRTLSLAGLPPEPLLAVFQGPGMATAPDPTGTLTRLAAEKVDALLVLGGLGLEGTSARQHLSRLTSLGLPVLFLAGGRDSAKVVEDARAALAADQQAKLIDLTPYHLLALPGYVLVLVAGSEGGQSAIHESACGFKPSDLESIEDAAQNSPAGQRVLVSWEIPAGSPLAAAPPYDLGGKALGHLQAEVGAKLGMHAWPDLQTMRPRTGQGDPVAWGAVVTDLQLAVPRLYGPPHTRSDDTRQLPGYAILRLGRDGVSVEQPR